MYQRLLTFAVVSVVTSSAWAQTELTWKFTPGNHFFVLESTETKQDISVGDRKVEQVTEHVCITSFTVDEVAEEGTTRLTMRLVKVTGKGAKNDATFNQQVEGAIFKVELDKDLEIKTVRGIDELLKNAGGNSPVKLLGQIVSNQFITERYVIKPLNRLFQSTPTNPYALMRRGIKSTSFPLAPSAR